MRVTRPPHLPVRGPSRPRAGFTLIELLIVVAIVGVLATMLLSAIFGAKTKTQVGVAKSQIRAIEAALSMYKGDNGSYPRHTPRPSNSIGANDPCWNDDAPALYMALLNRPVVALGGGANSPYLDWKPEAIGIVEKNTLVVNFASGMSSGALPLPPSDFDKVKTATFQEQYKRTASRHLVLLDPWGNPYHYREWGSVRQSLKDAYMNNPNATRTIVVPPGGAQSGQAPISTNPIDNIHNPDSFDIWSNGPNGVNEWGAPGSDDVTSWSQ